MFDDDEDTRLCFPDLKIPILTEHEPLQVVCGFEYRVDSIKVIFYKDSLDYMLQVARKIVMIPNFTMQNCVFVSEYVPTIRPYHFGRIGLFEGNVQLKFKWILRSFECNYEIVPEILKIVLLIQN